MEERYCNYKGIRQLEGVEKKNLQFTVILYTFVAV